MWTELEQPNGGFSIHAHSERETLFEHAQYENEVCWNLEDNSAGEYVNDRIILNAFFINHKYKYITCTIFRRKDAKEIQIDEFLRV